VADRGRACPPRPRRARRARLPRPVRPRRLRWRPHRSVSVACSHPRLQARHAYGV